MTYLGADPLVDPLRYELQHGGHSLVRENVRVITGSKQQISMTSSAPAAIYLTADLSISNIGPGWDPGCCWMRI